MCGGRGWAKGDEVTALRKESWGGEVGGEERWMKKERIKEKDDDDEKTG